MSDGLNITVDLSAIERFAQALAASPEIAGEENYRAVTGVIAAAEQLIAGNTPTGATGNLRGSITSEIRGTPLDLAGEIFTPLLYGEPVEYGRKPGRPPPSDAIRVWVVRKLGLEGKEADSAAYLIARAIGRRGTQGAHMFQNGIEATQPIADRLFAAIPERVFERIEKQAGAI